MSSIAAIDRRCFLPPEPQARPRSDSPWARPPHRAEARQSEVAQCDGRAEPQEAEPALAI
ncbi:MAG: hypothetical protein GC203_19960 [Phenylobacterium sp.]|uniref:hypothetical protein n=1 Tax=Phenylobacterium sp. TaxID=1871053 RepID=UPI0025DA38AB|nr:hypothetical protein [Phenylobacterium sp.]MBI1200141.1 hypothetical protein [Phenylobacterium sp.]